MYIRISYEDWNDKPKIFDWNNNLISHHDGSNKKEDKAGKKVINLERLL